MIAILLSPRTGSVTLRSHEVHLVFSINSAVLFWSFQWDQDVWILLTLSSPSYEMNPNVLQQHGFRPAVPELWNVAASSPCVAMLSAKNAILNPTYPGQFWSAFYLLCSQTRKFLHDRTNIWNLCRSVGKIALLLPSCCVCIVHPSGA